MKNWVICFITFFYISSVTPVSQIYKLPVFVSHFIEHDEGRDFVTEMTVFLVHHYGGHEVDDDWETDQKLPFMKVEIAHYDQILLPVFKLNFPVYKKVIHQEPMLAFDEDIAYSYYLNSIWQPPKQA